MSIYNFNSIIFQGNFQLYLAKKDGMYYNRNKVFKKYRKEREHERTIEEPADTAYRYRSYTASCDTSLRRQQSVYEIHLILPRGG
jgi:hypothetical protein